MFNVADRDVEHPVSDDQNLQILAAEDPAAVAKIIERIRKTMVVPHVGQRPVADSDAVYRVLRAGRRWGKTELAAHEVVKRALGKPDGMIWWVANTYKNVRRGYRKVVKQIPRELLAKAAPPSTANELTLQLTNGTTIEFYSGGNPDAMAGEGVDFMVVDEAALIAEHVWTQILEPTLIDTDGDALIISTPRGRNWFWRLYQLGQREDEPDYQSWHFTSYDSPYTTKRRIDSYIKNNPAKLARQEIFAEFLDGASSIFNLENAVEQDGIVQPEGHVILGVDVAKQQDFTVLWGINAESGLPSYIDRFNGLPYNAQKDLIKEAVEELEAWPGVTDVTVGLDTNGVGDAVFDDLENDGLDIEPVPFTAQKKPLYVKRMGADLEHKRAVILKEAREEFEAFEYTITPSGNMTFQAAAGFHDDYVDAAIIANWIRTQESAGEVHVETFIEEEAEQQAEIVISHKHKPAATTGELLSNPDVWSRM